VLISPGGPTIVFLTVCTRGRTPWLAQDPVHQALADTWRAADSLLVGYYLLMPDHLHLFCAPRDLRHSLDAWGTYWKRRFTLEW
jgi:putative transposase